MDQALDRTAHRESPVEHCQSKLAMQPVTDGPAHDAVREQADHDSEILE